NKVDRATLRWRIIAVSQKAVHLPDRSRFRVKLNPAGELKAEDCEAILAAVML
ncbi:uncharacterized protein LY79DRAFT_525433, partial [Colletotrichum navitas]